MSAAIDKLLSVMIGLVSCLSAVTFAFLIYRISARQFRQTTLDTAIIWSVIAMTACTVVWFVDTAFALVKPGAGDLMWYVVSILLLCPPIAVLGAKRPGVRVWNVFILLPLVLVFTWPALADGRSALRNGAFEIETPMVLGYFLVLIMGVGNYLGTRSTLVALQVLGGAGLLIFRSTTMFSAELFQFIHFVAVTMLMLGAAQIAVQSDQPTSKDLGYDRVWLDFRDWFGIVWSRRVQERVNDTAAKEKWIARLEHHGFVWDNEASEEQIAETNERINHTMRWLLRRFVDDPWIDERLNEENVERVKSPA